MDLKLKLVRNVYYLFRGLILLLIFSFYLAMIDILRSVNIFIGDSPRFWGPDKTFICFVIILSLVFFIPLSLYKEMKKRIIVRFIRLISPLMMALTSTYVEIGIAFSIALVVIVLDQFLISIASKFKFKF